MTRLGFADGLKWSISTRGSLSSLFSHEAPDTKTGRARSLPSFKTMPDGLLRHALTLIPVSTLSAPPSNDDDGVGGRSELHVTGLPHRNGTHTHDWSSKSTSHVLVHSVQPARHRQKNVFVYRFQPCAGECVARRATRLHRAPAPRRPPPRPTARLRRARRLPSSGAGPPWSARGSRATGKAVRGAGPPGGPSPARTGSGTEPSSAPRSSGPAPTRAS